METCNLCRTIAALFRFGRSTVCEVVIGACEAISYHCIPKHVCVPKNDSLQEVHVHVVVNDDGGSHRQLGRLMVPS